EAYAELHSFYLLIDRPSVYGLPDNPVNPWLHMRGDYLRAVAAGLIGLAALLGTVLARGGWHADPDGGRVRGPGGDAAAAVARAGGLGLAPERARDRPVPGRGGGRTGGPDRVRPRRRVGLPARARALARRPVVPRPGPRQLGPVPPHAAG